MTQALICFSHLREKMSITQLLIHEQLIRFLTITISLLAVMKTLRFPLILAELATGRFIGALSNPAKPSRLSFHDVPYVVVSPPTMFI